MEIVLEKAETVRLIYQLFMQGQTPYAIAKYLTDRNIPTPTGKETWRHRTVENILSNEKYKRTVWQCNDKFKGESRCATPSVPAADKGADPEAGR